ncbi:MULTISPECIES: hypothetical protein [unclassified Sphingomonas]|uniref:hypothetical protein n=1 Tax=unclassified Sphingomonas TaxID=196159 RepID=UPI001F571F87|nr:MULTISPECIES: hypothetical protein [unclassified Sphingomonas]
MATTPSFQADPGEESLIILQSLLCLMREKNLLTRADIEELCHKVERRSDAAAAPMPISCCPQSAAEASGIMQRLTSYIGQRYGGKHLRAYR